MYVMRGFSAAKSLVMGIKLPKKFLHLFAKAALFLLSFFIYFSLSSNLFNHTNFWFFLTNTLIFIIAADSGAFSPPSSFVAATDTVPTPPKDFNKIVVVKEPPNSPILTQNEEEEEIIIQLTTEKTSIPPKFNNSRKSYQRSKSEKEIKRLREKAGKITMKRSKTMIRHDTTTTKKKEEEKDEFAEMTNEELNRRVEEFIERFNRQIRLQEINEHGNENRELLI
ncbi:uncharacterized protein LOC120083777 [Benincasa hispida]|uniref:uncharacterized protein LOC120083777 n=1 Tax=Benincasa hispida TaxID=102211 RepID=UPI00190056CF|nr:uncharacterized protein LOC120083777 [Benincasa hispida]